MELNPFSYEFHEDPYPVYAWLREHAPLYYNPKLEFYALTRFHDVWSALQDWRAYSSREGVTLERIDTTLFEVTPMMIFMDPPQHDRLRRLVSAAFTPRRIAALEPFIRELAQGLIARLRRDGGGDFVADFAAPLPREVIFTLLGVPVEDRVQLREWMDRALERDPDSPEIPSRAIEASMNLVRYWFQLLERLRRQPNDGLICALFSAEIEHDNGTRTKLSDGEIAGFCALLGAAGNETVTRLLGNAIVLFHRHPDQWRKLVQDPLRIPQAMEEVLRYWPPSQYQARTVTKDAEWYGETVPAGARILLVNGAATRDPRAFSDPDTFDIDRQIPLHLSFGYGVHFCLGASLARLEARVAMEEFVQAFPEFFVDESRCVRAHMSNVHGFDQVPFASR
ncbi:MAG: cytochrome P450 [Candidatus Binatia bacterium]|nr:cytochrome P450 [Candidatus Binatia bacterium]